MTRTNIDIDDDLVAQVMAQNHLKTKKEAVDFALRRTVRRTPTVEEILALEGIGFGLSVEEVKSLSAPRNQW
jgi:Arc/MetJ family transcription regulator